MSFALRAGERGGECGEVPIGAVTVHNGEVLVTSHNETEQKNDPTAHAEIIALRETANILGDWRLGEVALFVTIEPCTMCMGAIRLARVPLLVFGASEPHMGACGSLYDLAIDERLGRVPRVISGVCETESRALMQGFFQRARKG